VIAPFNFPAAILIGMSAGALITGNTIILEPSSDTPIIAYKFAQIMEGHKKKDAKTYEKILGV
jgi:1-pyrroline-5-carboxylate dehydrogenase